jgi:hypothetical protein
MSVSGDDPPPQSRKRRIDGTARFLQQLNGGELEDNLDEASSYEPERKKRYDDSDLIEDGFREASQHPYQDLDGKVLFQVVRYQHKSVKGAKKFRQRRPDHDGHWITGAGDVKVPYRWPELARRPKEEIFYCEGEKNADYLASKGLLATTCASQAWNKIIAQALAGRTVHVMADCDEKGEENAAKAERWLRGVGTEVRIVRLPGLNHNQDVEDWLKTHSVEELVAYARSRRLSGLTATPARLPDPKSIPLRQWLYYPYYVRRSPSATIAPGGVGKSTLTIAEALAMASGKQLLDVAPAGQLKVWYWNGEDSTEELERRVAAAMKFHDLTKEDIGGRLFLDSGRESPIVIASEERGGIQVNQQLIREMTNTILANKIDVLIIDPFVSSHMVNENDNTRIDRVVKSLGAVAEETNCAVMIVHHARKTTNGAISIDDSRGAKALIDAARASRVLNTMSEHDAEVAEIEECERRSYFRSDNGKGNLTPAEFTSWFKLENVDIENHPCALGNGDKVGVATMWSYPETPEIRITEADVIRIQQTIGVGGKWRKDSRTEDEPWVGKAIAEVLGIDLRNAANRKAVNKIVKDWLRSGLLKVEERLDANRKKRKYVDAGSPPAPAEEPIITVLPDGLNGSGEGLSTDPRDLLQRRRPG